MRIVWKPGAIEEAWLQQYGRLAQKIASLLYRKGGVLGEVGCGRGQLTIPLAKKIPQYRVIAVDNFEGSYSKDLQELSSSVARNKMTNRIDLVISDYMAWLSRQPASSYDAIISSEFLPEIDSSGLHKFLVECHRILKDSGVTIHTFLSPQAANLRQKRLIEADSDPEWTETPPSEWFSPPQNLVLNLLRWIGFKKVRQLGFASGLVFRSEAAKQLLRSWEIRESYWRSHKGILEREGIEIPDWIVVSGFKQS